MPNKYILVSCMFFVGILLLAGTLNMNDHHIVGFGSIKSSRGKLSGVSIKIYQGDELVQQSVSDRNGSYAFFIKFNKIYQITFAKEGFIRQSVFINTTAPDDAKNYSNEFLWEPDIEMFPYIKGMKQDEFAFPLAKYLFDDDLFRFAPLASYATSIQDTLQETKHIIDAYAEKVYHQLIQEADSCIRSENYKDALYALQEADKYKPGLKATSKKLKTTKKEFNKTVSLDEEYQQALQTGDKYFATNEFELAIKAYQTAIIYKPKSQYPIDQLYVIDSVKSYQWIKKNDTYSQCIAMADSLLVMENFDSSKAYYTKSLSIFPDMVYPKQQNKRIDSILKALEYSQPEQDVALTLQMEDIKKTRKKDKDGNSRDTSPIMPPTRPIQEKTTASTVNETTPVKAHSEPLKKPELTMPHNLRDESIDNQLVKANVTTKREDLNIERLTSILAEKVELGNKAESADVLEKIGQLHQSEFELGKALEAYTKALNIKKELGDRKGESNLLSEIAGVMYDSGSYTQSIEKFEESLEIAENLQDKEQSSDILIGIATVLESSFQYEKAIAKLERSFHLKREMGDTLAGNDIARSIGNIYYQQQDYKKAAEVLESSLRIDEERNNTEEMGATLNSLGATYYGLNEYEKATEYFNRSLEVNRDANNLREQSITLNNIGNINFDFSKYGKAIEYYEQSIQLKRQINFGAGIASTLHNIGNAYFAQNKYSKALEYYQSSQEAAVESGNQEVIWRNLEAFAKTYRATGDFKKALEYYQQYTHAKYEIRKEQQQITELRQQYEVSKIAVKSLKLELQKQNRLAEYEAERNRKELELIQLTMNANIEKLKRQRNIIISFIIGSLLILIFSIVITRQYQQKQKAYRIVAEQKKHIEDGISYAARIQAAVLPPKNFIDTLLPPCFILNLPRDIVSGDFYWAAKHHSKTVVAVADCTGHGVPGGFMSMLGVSILNEIISTEEILAAHDILMHLRQRVITALHQREEKTATPDGMDISVLIFEQSMRKVEFAGAYHTLFLVQKGELKTVKGNRMPIGHHFSNKAFTSTSLSLEKDDMIYMTSDGIVNQIGQKSKNRFMASRFKGELAGISNLPLEKQKDYLYDVIRNWQGTLEQTDDILIMGIRIC